MESLIYPFLISLFFAAGFWLYKRNQHQRLITSNLIPNCLLTKTPLMFVVPAEGLFKLKNVGKIFYFTFQNHGYKTLWTETENNRKDILSKLDDWESKGNKFHFFIPPQSEEIWKQILKNRNYSCVRSLSILNFTSPKQALDRVIELAEEDFF